MIYKNVEFHNVEKIIMHDDGSISWGRVPDSVANALETGDGGRRVAQYCTGVELRFVMKSDRVTIRMSAGGGGRFHVYRGGIQGSWSDHETDKNISASPADYVIERAPNADRLRLITAKSNLPWDSDVIRVIFDLGDIRIFDIIGDVCPPTVAKCPQRTLLCYGSSITHGSNSIDISHSWSSLLGQHLGMDVRNLGMAGSCALEPEFADWIASEGEKGRWNIATLELGINVLGWTESKMRQRSANIIQQVAGRNPDKPVFVISPFYCCGEMLDNDVRPQLWRNVLSETVDMLKLTNVHYIDGHDVLDNMTYMSADEVHPNIVGVAKIESELFKRISGVIE